MTDTTRSDGGLTAEEFWQGKCQYCGHEDEAHRPWCGVIVGSDGGVMPEPSHCNCITHESVARHVAAAIARHVRETGCDRAALTPTVAASEVPRPMTPDELRAANAIMRALGAPIPDNAQRPGGE